MWLESSAFESASHARQKPSGSSLTRGMSRHKAKPCYSCKQCKLCNHSILNLLCNHLHHICRTKRCGSKVLLSNPLRMPDKSHLGARSQGACRGTRQSLAIPVNNANYAIFNFELAQFKIKHKYNITFFCVCQYLFLFFYFIFLLIMLLFCVTIYV